ncbi:vancomycin high temperature exclusion protein [Cellulophaga sp. HaHa_2_1]|uniref:SanA/YdcF family protein n=1 Tax=Cellulophaga sp. HaHa_2_1 TaxID=2749994 RepID=UPI001C4F671F|nr:ElyC/SanA/YdcF family protein [Cellulophaga sp. HaHa_2_1]QXP51614.1 YdcF family protein [Cellulophaga sp. HaHa_2_1]
MLKRILKVIAVSIVFFFAILFICNCIIDTSTEEQTYTSVDKIPTNKVGLILGTAKRLVSGHPNPYYTNRITATIALYKANKIKFVLVSGDNGSIYYNEPKAIKKDLIKGGIPEDKIFLDYAGFRTLDSMMRAKHVFGLTSVTVISQEFHNDRAIYLAHKKGLKAIGFNAKDITGKNGLKVQLREYFARVKVFLDLLTNKQPKFYGEKIEIK